MSATTSRPRVRSVSSTALSASSVATAGAIILTGRALSALVYAVDRPLAECLERSRPAAAVPPSELRSVPLSRRDQLIAERRVLAGAAAAVPPLETLKLSALAGLDAAAFAMTPRVIDTPLCALAAAHTADGVARARIELRRIAESSHLAVLSASVAAACEDACKAVGFARVHIAPDPMRDGLRVVATDDAGRGLVSEVRVHGDHVGMETEVAGVTDGSCAEILDRFDRELDARGVRAERTRAYTGGMCRLASARQVAQRLSRPFRSHAAASRRGQRLNPAPVVKPRQR